MEPLVLLISRIIGLYIYLLIFQAILSWLITFGIINTQSSFVNMIGNFLYKITEPLLRPIRKLLPDFLFWLSFVSIIYFFGDFAYFESHIRVPHIAYLLLIGTVVNAAIQVMGSSLFFNEHIHPKSYFAIALILIGAALL